MSVDNDSREGHLPNFDGLCNLFMDMCMNMYINMCMNMCMEMCVEICMDACTDMCVDLCMQGLGFGFRGATVLLLSWRRAPGLATLPHQDAYLTANQKA